jgi:3-isopropylmalate/(R)-2-methylmalate dehydratase small subunit
MADLPKIEEIVGRGCVVRGNDIDTDRIIPARFMKEITFETMGEHLFEDARKAAKGRHLLDDDCYAGATILVVGENFGCGSSREHAPQSLMRYGFRAFVGESFAEIFFGNCVSLGLPCISLAEADIESLMGSVELDPEQEITLDVAACTVASRSGTMQGTIADGARKQLIEGRYDGTSVLLEAGDLIEQTAARLPYVAGA